MPTGADLIQNGQRFLGEPYSTNPGRDDPSSGFGDCSGGVEKTYLITTGHYIGDPGHVSSSIFDHCRDSGLEVPGGFAAAIDIPGTVLFCPEDPDLGDGDLGHVGFVGFNRTTLEWTPPMCQSLSVYYQPWSRSKAVYLPGIFYSGQGPQPSPVPQRKRPKMLMFHIVDRTLGGTNWVLFDLGSRHYFPVPEALVESLVAQGAINYGDLNAAQFDRIKAGEDPNTGQALP